MKIKLIIEDHGTDGGVAISIEGEETFPAKTSDWTSAMRAAMWAYHALGQPGQDLSTTDTDGEA